MFLFHKVAEHQNSLQVAGASQWYTSLTWHESCLFLQYYYSESVMRWLVNPSCFKVWIRGNQVFGIKHTWAFCWIRDKNLPSISIHINLIQLKVCKARATQTKRSRRGRGLIAVMSLSKRINKLFWNWLIFDIVDFHNVLLLNILLLFYCFI